VESLTGRGQPPTPTPAWTARLAARRWLTPGTFEIALERPAAFRFTPGQRIRLGLGGATRDYSLLGPADHPRLHLCIRRLAGGPVSTFLAEAPPETTLHFDGPLGYFVWRPSPRPAVWLATGTGVAPFVALARAGVRGFRLAHGVRAVDELYYAEELRAAAALYVPCLTTAAGAPPDAFRGRVTEWAVASLAPGIYDFYLCGRGEMIRDATRIIDAGFAGSRVFSEIFF
jgi:ferredoxin-NADP reductase